MEEASERKELIASQIVDSAIKVHQNLGPGLLEKVYEACLCRELEKRNLEYQRQLEVPIVYDGIVLNESLRLDIIVENTIICEVKSASNSHHVWEAQLLSYMKLSEKQLGFILNFGMPLMKEGIKRFIL